MAMSDWQQDNFLETIAGGLPPHGAASEAADPLKQAIARHQAECPGCRDLQVRLERFEGSDVVPGDAGWEQAKPRLESRLRRIPEPETGPRGRGGSLWQMRWALIPAAAILVVLAFLAGRVSVRQPAPRVQKIARAPAEPPPTPVRTSQAPTSRPAPGPPVPAIQAAASPTPAAPAPLPASPAGEPGAVTLSSTQVRLSAMRPGVAPRPAPARIRIEAGTRVWIALRSVGPQRDGVSGFGGVVLLPVVQSGVALLSRNMEVSGTMTILTNGKRSVKILEFRSPEAHYTLRGAEGEANLRLLGAGEVVEFDAGRVLETWMAAGSDYESVPGPSRLPQ